MEHLEEVNKLMANIRELNQMLSRVGSITLSQVFSSNKDCIYISDHENTRYTLTTINELIGERSMDNIILTLEDLLFAALSKRKSEVESLIAKYKLTHE